MLMNHPEPPRPRVRAELSIPTNRRYCILMIGTVLWTTAGCLAPNGPAPEVTIPVATEIPPRRTARVHTATQIPWQPVVGRMDELGRHRHRPPGQPLPWRILVSDGFKNASSVAVPHWQIAGFPSLRTDTRDDRQAVVIGGAPDVAEPCGLTRSFEAGPVAGRYARLRLMLSCRSPEELAAARRTRVVLVTEHEEQKTHVTSLPLSAGIAPGWEWQSWCVKLPATLTAVQLSVLTHEPAGRIALGGIEWAVLDDTPSPVAGAEQAGHDLTALVHRNRIIDGNFETGGACFFASGIGRRPNGEPVTTAMSWDFDPQAVSGETSLRLHLQELGGRVGFGPVDLLRLADPAADGKQKWHLRFCARAGRAATVTATLRTSRRTLGSLEFQLRDTWHRFSGHFDITLPARMLDPIERRNAELVFTFTGDGSPAVNPAWLDAVMLTAEPVTDGFVRSSPVEIGLSAAHREAVDLSHILDQREKLALAIRLVGPAAPTTAEAGTATDQPSTGTTATTQPSRSIGPFQLAIDVLDAWDRTVGSHTATVKLDDAGRFEHVFRMGVPRGYYRVLASAWAGPPGEADLLGQADLAVAVISMFDAVPFGNVIGLTAEPRNLSLMTAALGAGWIKVGLNAGHLAVGHRQWDFAEWATLMEVCKQAHLQVVADLSLPTSADPREAFLNQWLSDDPLLPLGLIVRQPVTTPASTPAAELDLVRTIASILKANAPATRLVAASDLVSDLTSAASGSLEGIILVRGVHLPAADPPERMETQLEALADQRSRSPGPLWDLGVAAELAGAPQPRLDLRRRVAASPDIEPNASALKLYAEPKDPIRSASRMVRAMMIRTLVGAEMICSEAKALAPVASRFETDPQALHESNLSPKPAVAAFDLAAELLNDATLQRWIDLPDNSRVLYFTKADGRGVAAIWRPYGLSPSYLAMSGLPEAAQVVDVMGSATPPLYAGVQRVVIANEMVRYLIVSSDEREPLEQALSTMTLLTAGHAPVTTQPAATGGNGPQSARPR